MSRLRVFLSFAALLFVAVAATADQVDDLAAAHYPDWLDADYEVMTADGTAPVRRWMAMAADLDGTGTTDYVVAVYCNSVSGNVRVLRAGVGVIAQTNYPAMGGMYPKLRLVDLTGDGRPEIVASFTAMHGDETWILNWQQRSLVSIAPTKTLDNGVVNSVLGTSDFFDVDGDGLPEILVMTDGDPGDPPKDVVYKLGSGRFAPTGTSLLYANRFVRGKGEPEIFTAVIRAVTGQKVQIKVVNGDGAGDNVATSGELWFNGKQLLGPNDFKKKSRLFTLQATAAELNEIEVDLEGKPGSEVTVSVTPVQ